jgi:Ser/Thr protein kinase RdoA (MazF antagonist)
MNPSEVEKRVLQCLSDNYGLRGVLKRLSGENLNYLLTLENGVRHVVKIVDEDMPSEVVEMESEALKYAVSAGFSLKLPEIIENINKKLETGIVVRINGLNRLRVITFIEGNELERYPDISSKMVSGVGEIIAEFNLVMRDFDHPAAHRNHRWNLVESGQHRVEIGLVENPQKQALLQWGFDTWGQVKSGLQDLPWQFIHGDLNRENILVERGQINGLVDFGDCCMNPTVCDLAIATTYFMMDQDNPLQNAQVLIDGYQEIRPLDQAEHAVLLPLVCGRLATSIAVSQARKLIDPGNPNWFSGEDSAWRLLGQVRNLLQNGIGFV